MRGDSEDDDDDEDDWVIRSQARSVRRAKLDKRRFLRQLWKRLNDRRNRHIIRSWHLWTVVNMTNFIPPNTNSG